MPRNSAVDLWRALVGLSAEKSIVVPLRRSPLNSSRKVNSSILGASFLVRLDGDVSLISDSLVGEPEMAGRLVERRVEDRVLDDDLAHGAPRIIDSFGIARSR